MSMIDDCLSIYMKIHWVFKLLISLNFLFCYFSHTNTHTFKNKNNTSSHSQDYLEFYQRKHHLKYGAVDNYVGVITVEQSMDQVKSVENDEELKLVIVNCVLCACLCDVKSNPIDVLFVTNLKSHDFRKSNIIQNK